MKNYHTNARRFDQPITMFLFKKTVENGIMNYVFDKKIFLKGSVMQQNKVDLSTGTRADDSTISLVIPNPPFEIKPETTKFKIQNNWYAIQKVDFNWLTYGEIRLFLIYEKEYVDESSNSALEFVLEGTLSD